MDYTWTEIKKKCLVAMVLQEFAKLLKMLLMLLVIDSKETENLEKDAKKKLTSIWLGRKISSDEYETAKRKKSNLIKTAPVQYTDSSALMIHTYGARGYLFNHHLLSGVVYAK